MNEISDLDVITVGLVDKGANKKKFFLMKSDKGDQMTDELKIEEVIEETPDVQDNLLQKIWKAVKPAEAPEPPATPDPDQIDAALSTLSTADPDLLKAAQRKAGAMGGGGAGSEDDEEDDEDEAPVVQGKKKMKKNDGPNIQEIIQAEMVSFQKAADARLESIIKAHNAEVTELKTRLEKAEEDVNSAKERNEKNAWIEKAQFLRATPVSPIELGEKFHTLAKFDNETAEYFNELLKSMDAQLGAAGIFAELGTARSAEQLAIEEKIEKADDVEAALLGLSDADQARLLDEMRKAGK